MNKLFKRITFTVIILVIVLAAAGCGGNDNPPDAVKDDFYVIQIGKTFDIYGLGFGKTKYTAVIKDAEGAEVDIEIPANGKVSFPETGEYKITYTAGNDSIEIKVYVADTQAPRFDQPFEGCYFQNITLYNSELFNGEEFAFRRTTGQTFKSSEYLRAKDNSGNCDVTYKVYKGGAEEITLSESGSFTVEICDYYRIVATATDPSNNITQVIYYLINTSYIQ